MGLSLALLAASPDERREAAAWLKKSLVAWHEAEADAGFGPAQAREMRRVEQTATLISKQDDPELPGIRFVAESSIHRVRVNMTIHGFRAWAFYAGTVVGRPENKAELELAERAREASSPGLPEDYQPPAATTRPVSVTSRPSSVR